METMSLLVSFILLSLSECIADTQRDMIIVQDTINLELYRYRNKTAGGLWSDSYTQKNNHEAIKLRSREIEDILVKHNQKVPATSLTTDEVNGILAKHKHPQAAQSPSAGFGNILTKHRRVKRATSLTSAEIDIILDKHNDLRRLEGSANMQKLVSWYFMSSVYH